MSYLEKIRGLSDYDFKSVIAVAKLKLEDIVKSSRCGSTTLYFHTREEQEVVANYFRAEGFKVECSRDIELDLKWTVYIDWS